MRIIIVLTAFFLTLTSANSQITTDEYTIKQKLIKKAFDEYKRRITLLDKVIEEDEKSLSTLHKSELLKQSTSLSPSDIPYLQEELEDNKEYRDILVKGFSEKKEVIEKAFTPIEDDYYAKVYEEKPLSITLVDQSKILYPELLETLVIEKKETSRPILEESLQRVRVGGIACDDMESNSVVLSPLCMEKMMNVLNYFTKDHYYELIPILDKQPLVSFSLLRGKVPTQTIHYLETMALQGIAQSRISQARELIRKIHGEKVNIDYSLTYIQREDRRGFALRIYK